MTDETCKAALCVTVKINSVVLDNFYFPEYQMSDFLNFKSGLQFVKFDLDPYFDIPSEMEDRGESVANVGT